MAKLTLKNIFLNFKSFVPVILWTGLIFFFSHQPGLNSGLPNFWDFVLRKSAHIFEYAVLTFLLIRNLEERNLEFKKALVLSAVLAVFYAIFDEYHQTFIAARQGKISDIGIDSLGIIIISWLAWQRNKNKQEINKSQSRK